MLDDLATLPGYYFQMHITTSVTPRTLSIRDGVRASAHLVQSTTLLAAGMQVAHCWHKHRPRRGMRCWRHTPCISAPPTLRRRLAHEHTTFNALLLDVRLSYALMLLQATDGHVGRIALDAGFQNHAHFSRLFKCRFGVTPTQVRRQASPALARTGTNVARLETGPVAAHF